MIDRRIIDIVTYISFFQCKPRRRSYTVKGERFGSMDARAGFFYCPIIQETTKNADRLGS